MKLVKRHGSWVSDDEAELHFPRAPFDDNPPKPSEVAVKVAGWSGCVQPAIQNEALARLKLIVAVGFENEQHPNYDVTSNKKYAAYEITPNDLGHPRDSKSLVLVSNTGCGLEFLLLQDVTPELFRALTKELPQNGTWRLIQSYFATYEKANQEGVAKTQLQFLDKRLKRRRRNGRVSCEVLPESEGAAAKAKREAA